MPAELLNDTIVAVSSALGASPEGIIRLSGPDALSIVQHAQKDPSRPIPSTNYRAFPLKLNIGDAIVPARGYLMRAPTSYTREDVMELHFFGNPVLQERMLQQFEKLGARPAEAGEFTRRAFENGRLDLAQAEAVEALIHAQGESDYRAAQEVLMGRLSERLRNIRRNLLELTTQVEVALDFTDQDVEIIRRDEAARIIEPVRQELHRLSQHAPEGRLRSKRTRVAFLGPPNAGKSSLFNALLRHERAIVSPHPGTTRDTIEAVARLDGIELTLIDTAGIRSTADEIEALAVARSHRSAREAELLLYVLDGSVPIENETREALSGFMPSRLVILLNKCDLAATHEAPRDLPPGVEYLRVSAVTGEGIAQLVERLRERILGGAVDRAPSELMVNARQAGLLRRAREALDRAALQKEEPLELLAEELHEALNALGRVTGDEVNDEVLNAIFEKFCIGK